MVLVGEEDRFFRIAKKIVWEESEPSAFGLEAEVRGRRQAEGRAPSGVHWQGGL
jgi:hypothetical protein